MIRSSACIILILLCLVLSIAGGCSPKERHSATPVLSPDQQAVIEEAVKAGNEAVGNGRIDASELEFRKVLEIDPYNGHALVGMGRVGLARDNKKLAEKYFRQALEYHPDLGSAHLFMGDIFLVRGNTIGCIRHLKMVKENDPDYENALFTLGRIYLSKGSAGSAARIFRKTLSVNPNFQDAYYQLAIAYSRMGKEGLAVNSLMMAVRMNPMFAYQAGLEKDFERLKFNPAFQQIVRQAEKKL
ncbi:MAG: tetratricopeptide repeat protein [Chloroflexi bacterium]|nr:tetratricopeptide repeat protein [Chloroflexota bacterium]